jgi:hypothetical protein
MTTAPKTQMNVLAELVWTVAGYAALIAFSLAVAVTFIIVTGHVGQVLVEWARQLW